MNRSLIAFCVISNVLFLLEGLGLPYGHIASFYGIILIPFLLLILNPKIFKSLIFPKQLSILFLIFLVFSMISVTQGLQIFPSFMFIFFYLSLFFTFVLIYSHKDIFSKYLLAFIYGISIILSAYSLILNWLIKQGAAVLIPFNGYQFVFSSFGAHNHLGDLLAVSLVLSFYQFFSTKNKLFFLPIIIFTPIMLLSYSRSAYLSLSLGLIYLIVRLIKQKKQFKFFLPQIFITGLIVFIMGIFFFVTVSESKYIPILNQCNQFLKDKLGLKEKYFISKRIEYFDQARRSIVDKPLFGVGPDNFIFASQKYTQIGFWSTSSHNIFLDTFVENGGLAFLAFLLILFRIVISAFKTNSFITAGFLVMLVNFQTDYTFKIFSFWLLFTVFSALVYSEKNSIKVFKT